MDNTESNTSEPNPSYIHNSQKFEGEPASVSHHVYNPSGDLPNELDLLKEAWKIYRDRFFAFFGIALVGALPLTFLLYLSLALVALLLSAAFAADAEALKGVFMFIGIYGLLFLALTSFMTATILIVIRDRNERVGTFRALKHSAQFILPLAWVLFLLWVMHLFGFMLLVIPAIIFGIWFGFSIFIVSTEPERGINALLKSYTYVKGQWWSVARRIAVPLILLYLLIHGLSRLIELLGIIQI